jgi:hypothetical protein
MYSEFFRGFVLSFSLAPFSSIIILYSEIINKNKKDFLKGEAAQPAQLG